MVPNSLDAKTEHALCVRWARNRDPEARDQLIAAQQPIVHRIAGRYCRTPAVYADLVQEGNLGLMHALERFDPDRGVRLVAYASWWIRAFVLRYLEHNHGLVRGATTASRSRLFYQLARTRQHLAAAGEDVSRATIADALGVEEKDVDAMELLRRPTASLDAPADKGGTTALLDGLADWGASPEEHTLSGELRTRLRDALRTFERGLQGHQLEVFRDRVIATQPVTMQELGERWGMGRSAARRIEGQVTRSLRRHLYRQMGDTVTATLGAR